MKIVILTGAGISAESGLQTFRDSDGLWEGYDVHEVATPGAWKRNPELVLRFYNERRRSILNAKPNAAHLFLANLEKEHDVHIITQNIDNLHERAGSKNILHLHGEIVKMRSTKNSHLVYPILEDMKLGDLAEDGAQLRPAIVWFEEAVPMIEPAIEIVSKADILIVVGTSLVVYPAASLVHYVSDKVPVIVLDKRIPVIKRNKVYPIERSATQGLNELSELISQGVMGQL
ncbi:MAG: NAD-dependent deacylase [Chitinophagaceae bacterium]|nr:NAD-dependent deacylase [Chitinophagaceae bacterium]